MGFPTWLDHKQMTWVIANVTPSFTICIAICFLVLFEEARVKYDKFVLLNDIILELTDIWYKHGCLCQGCIHPYWYCSVLQPIAVIFRYHFRKDMGFLTWLDHKQMTWVIANVTPSFTICVAICFLALFEEASVKYDKFVLLNDIRAWLLCERPFRKRRGEDITNV